MKLTRQTHPEIFEHLDQMGGDHGLDEAHLEDSELEDELAKAKRHIPDAHKMHPLSLTWLAAAQRIWIKHVYCVHPNYGGAKPAPPAPSAAPSVAPAAVNIEPPLISLEPVVHSLEQLRSAVVHGLLGIGLLLLAILLATMLAPHAHGQTTVIRGRSKGTTPADSPTVTSTGANNNGLDVNIVGGGGTGGGPADAAPNAAASESDTARQKVTTAIRVLDTTQAAGAQLVTAKGDQTLGLWVNCKWGCTAAGDTATGSTALGALNAVITVPLAGENKATFQLQSGGTGVYSVTPQCSYDGGTFYNTNGYIQDPVSGALSLSATIASAQATTDYPVLCAQGSSHAQMKVTAYTSGTANWVARSTVNSGPNIAFGLVTTAAPSYTTGQVNGISLTTAGAMRVDGSGVTQPVSGTVSLGAGAASIGTVGLNAGTNAIGSITNTAFGVTGALPAGANSIGTVGLNAGTNAIGSITNTSFSATGTTASNSAAPSGLGVLPVQFNTVLPTLTSGNAAYAQSDSSGRLLIGSIAGAVTTTPPANASTNVTQFGGNAVVTGTGVSGLGIPRVTVSNDSSVSAVQSGTWTDRFVGNAGGILDAAGQNAAAPANWLSAGCNFFTTPTTIVSGNGSPLECDSSGNLLVKLNVNPTITNTGFNVNNTPTVVQGNAGTNAQAWWTRIGDATNGPAAVKAASTAVAAADPSLAVGLSPNSPLPTGSNTIGAVTGTLSDNNAAPSTTNVGALTGIARTDYRGGTAATAGRLVAPDVGTDGLLHVAQLPAIRPCSYTASADFALSSTTDIAVLPGNATTTVLVTEIRFSGIQTTAGQIRVEVIKRSTADSAGTSAAMTAVAEDSNCGAAVSAPLTYTGTGPTVGTAVGDVDNARVGLMAAGTATPNDIYVLNLKQKPIVLRGTAQQLALNLGGAVTGGTGDLTLKWIEITAITP